jgi:hypothetical protein
MRTLAHLAALSLAVLLASGCAANLPTRSGSVQASVQTPTERYETYRAALDKAHSLEELLPLTSEAVREEMAKTTPAYRKALLSDMQLRKLEWLRVVEEQVSGDVALLIVEGEQVVDPLRGTRGLGKAKVILLREEGIWRVDDETWRLAGEDTTGITPRDWGSATKPK